MLLSIYLRWDYNAWVTIPRSPKYYWGVITYLPFNTNCQRAWILVQVPVKGVEPLTW